MEKVYTLLESVPCSRDSKWERILFAAITAGIGDDTGVSDGLRDMRGIVSQSEKRSQEIKKRINDLQKEIATLKKELTGHYATMEVAANFLEGLIEPGNQSAENIVMALHFAALGRETNKTTDTIRYVASAMEGQGFDLADRKVRRGISVLTRLALDLDGDVSTNDVGKALKS